MMMRPSLNQVPDDRMWAAVVARDAAYSGRFCYAVTTTGVFCDPVCKARRPRRENVAFFAGPAEALKAGYRPCKRCRPLEPKDRVPEWVSALCRYIESHLEEVLTLEALARIARRSPFSLHRGFRAATGVTPRAYADACRLRAFKQHLQSGRPVTEAIYEAGYGSGTRLYARSGEQLGMRPGVYRRGGEGEVIRYSAMETRAGWVLLAATGRGVCSIRLGDDPETLETALREEYTRAELQRDDAGLAAWMDELRRHLSAESPALDLPLDVKATAFQRRVWDCLRTIPYGSTRSYGEVARTLGEPRATRAVARACASNPVALLVPCHRVVKSDGEPGGYRWGTGRKRELLRMEAGEAGGRQTGRPA